MDRLKCGPIVEMLGDDMSSVIWEQVREKLITPFVDIDLKVYDLSICNRNETDNMVTLQARDALRRFNCGIKCATITAERDVLEMYQLKRMWQSPNSVIRNALGGALFREPIICANVPPLIKQWRKPIVVARHAFGDQHLGRSLRMEGGFVWACKNYDGDIQSGFVAQGFGSLGLMTSVLICPDGRTMVADVAHGTVTKHFRRYRAGLETSTNSMATIFTWTKGIRHRGRLDGDAKLVDFARTLEKVVVELVESGYMTKDLAMCVKGFGNVRREDYLNTFEFINKVAEQMAPVYKQVFMEEAV